MIYGKETLRPLKTKVLVHKIEQGERRLKSGLITLDDNGRERGIKSRWAQVYAVGPEVTDIKEGEWILIAHGRWSRGVDLKNEQGKVVTTIRQVDYPDAIYGVQEDKPIDLAEYEYETLIQRNVYVKELDTFCDEVVDQGFIQQVNASVPPPISTKY